MLLKNFKSVSDFPTFTGLSNAASFDEEGFVVTDPKFPFKLIFHPTTEVHETLPSDLKYGSFFNTPFYTKLL